MLKIDSKSAVSKKLDLRKQTLRVLSMQELRVVGGGSVCAVEDSHHSGLDPLSTDNPALINNH
jgi:hypothetical protein